MIATVELHAREPRDEGTLWVSATVTTAEGTRSGPYVLELPPDASDDAVRAAIASLCGATAT